MKIRKIKSTEGLLLRELRLSALADSPHAFGVKLSDEEMKPMHEYSLSAEKHATSESSTTFIALDDNIPIGQIGAFFEKSSGKPFICAVWVIPTHRRLGVGRQLISTAMTWLTERGAHDIYAWVANTNTKAIEFYQSIWFQSTDEQQPLPSDADIMETLFTYERNA